MLKTIFFSFCLSVFPIPPFLLGQNNLTTKKLVVEHIVLWSSDWRKPESAFSFEIPLCCYYFFSKVPKLFFLIYVSIPTLALATRTSSIWWSTAFWPDSTNFPKVLSLLIHFEFEYFISATPETIYSIMVWTEKFLYVKANQFTKKFCFEACVKFLFFQLWGKGTETSFPRFQSNNTEITGLVFSIGDWIKKKFCRGAFGYKLAEFHSWTTSMRNRKIPKCYW